MNNIVREITYTIKDLLELNLSYMPFITNGGIFVPTPEDYSLGEKVIINIELPAKKEAIRVEGLVVWITPENALHHVISGVGVQLAGANALAIRTQIEELLDKTVEVGGYTYGILEEMRRGK